MQQMFHAFPLRLRRSREYLSLMSAIEKAGGFYSENIHSFETLLAGVRGGFKLCRDFCAGSEGYGHQGTRCAS
jgi:hypothetical protein